jgi:dCTP deaminase
MILSDVDLKRYISSGKLQISAMAGETIRENGLDLRFGREFAVMKRRDDKPFDSRGANAVHQYFDVYSDVSEFTIPPHSRCLSHTFERIKLPKDLMGFCELRSSYARLGLSIPPTIVDAGFEGQLTIEIIGGSFPVKVYPLDRFLHLVFNELTSPVVKPYTGKYQGQTGVQLPMFKR